MRILFINKFLYPKGGSETYCFNLADYLKSRGHSVEFFGMEHESNIAGNSLNLYVKNREFKKMSIEKIFYPFSIIYSKEAKKKIRKVIEHFKPDIIHLNNFNFQLTPSILYEIKKQKIPVIMTLHDYQLICPNHMLFIEQKNKICEACKGRKYVSCIKNKCIHNSLIKSVLAAVEGFLYYKLRTYDKTINCYISPSSFLKSKFVEFGENNDRIFVLNNFIVHDSFSDGDVQKGNYVLYFGRITKQKGITTLIEACRMLPEIQFVFAGSGDLENEVLSLNNIRYVGFKTGTELKKLISEALFSVYPSEWYENCPLSVLESQMYKTPVIGADIGGIPELIQDNVDGLLFKPGDAVDLAEKIKYLYENRNLLSDFSVRCAEKAEKYSIEYYYKKLLEIYNSAINK